MMLKNQTVANLGEQTMSGQSFVTKNNTIQGSSSMNGYNMTQTASSKYKRFAPNLI